MRRTYLVILTLSATLLVFGRCFPNYIHLYLLEMTYSLGQVKFAKIMALHDTITHMEGIKTIFFVMEVGNPIVLAVLDIEDLCTWFTLTDVLSKVGVMLKTERLLSCHQFAQDLNLDVNKFELPFRKPVTHVVGDIFHNKGKTSEEYNNLLRRDLQLTQKIFSENGWDLHCFSVAGRVPAGVVYFTNEPLKAAFNLTTRSRVAESQAADLRTVIDLQQRSCDQL